MNSRPTLRHLYWQSAADRDGFRRPISESPSTRSSNKKEHPRSRPSMISMTRYSLISTSGCLPPVSLIADWLVSSAVVSLGCLSRLRIRRQGGLHGPAWPWLPPQLRGRSDILSSCFSKTCSNGAVNGHLYGLTVCLLSLIGRLNSLPSDTNCNYKKFSLIII